MVPSRFSPYGNGYLIGLIIKFKKGITQHELACRLGKRDSEVSKWLFYLLESNTIEYFVCEVRQMLSIYADEIPIIAFLYYSVLAMALTLAL